MKSIALVSISLWAVSALSTHASTAQENWNKDCMQCHGKDGTSNTRMGRILNAKDLTDPKVQASFTDAKAAKSIKEGMKENGKTVMKAFGDKLTDDEVKALVAHVRGLKK